jgi:hypothetical protein
MVYDRASGGQLAHDVGSVTDCMDEPVFNDKASIFDVFPEMGVFCFCFVLRIIKKMKNRTSKGTLIGLF